MNRTAETAAQNLLSTVASGDYLMTPQRATARKELLAAINDVYPHMNAWHIYDAWSFGEMRSIRQAAAYVQTINDEDEEA